jgi:hypothetical protein
MIRTDLQPLTEETAPVADQTQSVLADLATRAQTPTVYDPDQHDVAVTIDPTDGEGRPIDLDGYRTNPRRATASRTVADAASFLAYLQRHDPLPVEVDSSGNGPDGRPPRATGVYEPDSRPVTIWADDRQYRFTGVLNDHTAEVPGWRDHTIRLQLSHDEDWTAWACRSGHPFTQEEAAEHVEALLHTVIEPDAADLLEIVSSLQLRRNMVIGQMVNLRSGATQITYSDEDQVSAGRDLSRGTLEVPGRIMFRVPVFIGSPPVDVWARFRYRQNGRVLRVSYQIERQSAVIRAAFDGTVAEIARTGRPVLLGTP